MPIQVDNSVFPECLHYSEKFFIALPLEAFFLTGMNKLMGNIPNLTSNSVFPNLITEYRQIFLILSLQSIFSLQANKTRNNMYANFKTLFS